MSLFGFSNLTSEKILELTALSNASYLGQTAPPGWIALTGSDIGFVEGPDTGTYRGSTFEGSQAWYGAPAARVYKNGSEITVSFRGTDSTSDYATYPDIIGNNNYISGFHYFLSCIVNYVTASAGQISSINIVGHSLGAAAANILRNVSATEFHGTFDQGTYLTIATPKVSSNPDILNIGFENDWVYKAIARNTPFISEDFFSTTDNIVLYDDAYSAENWPGRLFDPSDTSAHSATGYIEAVDRIIHSYFYNEMNRDSVVIVVSTNSQVSDKNVSTSNHFGSDAFFVGRDQNDNILGGNGVDKIDARGSDDTIQGGGGNDIINGGGGTDTAVFRGVRAEYSISQNADGSFRVAHTGGARSDGTDLLIDVELARFLDETIELNSYEVHTEIIFLQDLSGSFSNDLPAMRNSIDDVINRLKNDFFGSHFSLATLTDGGDYTAITTSSNTADAIQNAYNGFSAAGDEREAVLGALVNAASGNGLGLTPEAERIVIVATDETYRDGELPDNTSIADAKAALSANHATPIFAVTSDVRSIYEDLVAQLGRGAVVTLTSNADNFADAMRAAVAHIKGTLTALGDDGDDNLIGSDAVDGIFGGLGNDRVDGRAGNDIVDGGAGDDVVFGGAGNDNVIGGSGDDVVVGDFLSSISLANPSASAQFHSLTVPGFSANSIDLSSNFSLASNSDVLNAETVPHTTVTATGMGTPDFYAVRLAPGDKLVVDIDGASTSDSATSFDSYINVYNSQGSRVAYGDDSNPSNGAGGSVSGLDTYLEYTVFRPGIYFIEVREYGGTGVPFGGTYTINISVDGALDSGSSGLAGDDIVEGGDGDDILYGNAGSDVITGDDGFDIAFFDGAFSNYRITESDGETTLVHGNEIDVISSVEQLVFDDTTLNLITDGGGVAGQAYRLYQAAFDRAPDTAGVSFWFNQIEAGRVNLFSAASNFIVSQEFRDTYGAPETVSNAQFATLLYNNVLNRSPDESGYVYWVDKLNAGVSREEVLVYFSESIENRNLTEPAIADGFWLA